MKYLLLWFAVLVFRAMVWGVEINTPGDVIAQLALSAGYTVALVGFVAAIVILWSDFCGGKGRHDGSA